MRNLIVVSLMLLMTGCATVSSTEVCAIIAGHCVTGPHTGDPVYSTVAPHDAAQRPNKNAPINSVGYVGGVNNSMHYDVEDQTDESGTITSMGGWESMNSPHINAGVKLTFHFYK